MPFKVKLIQFASYANPDCIPLKCHICDLNYYL